MTKLLTIYLYLIAQASAAIPLGAGYIKYDWIGAIIMLFYGVLLFGVGNKHISKFASRYALIFILYLFINAVISVFGGATNPEGLRSYFGQYLIAIFVFIVISSLSINTKSLTSILDHWIALGCFASLLAIAQRLSGHLLIDGILFIPYYEGGSISKKIVVDTLASTAWFSEASWFGAFLVVPTVYALGKIILNIPYSASVNYFTHLAVRYLSALLLLLGVYLGYSLTTIISIVLGIALIVIVSGKRLILLTGMLIAISIIFVSDDLIATRIAELLINLCDFSPGNTKYGTTTSFYERSIAWSSGFDAFMTSPIFGVGLGQGQIPFDSAVITIAAELGMVGLLIYYLLPFVALRNINLLRQRGDQELFAILLMAMLSSDYFNGFVTHHGFNLQRWMLISLVFGWLKSQSVRLKSVSEKQLDA